MIEAGVMTKDPQTSHQDWHPADVVAALHKAGWTLRRLSRHYGYANGTTISVALHRRWPKGQRLIADAIGVPPEEIWPSRYRKSSRQQK